MVSAAAVRTIPRKSRGLAVALALFLGGFGFHKFYLEKPGVGLLYFLFCWTFIPAIISLFEAIYYIAIGESGFQKMLARGRH
jgi:TM2 domain-containing membrane protein YozV